MCFDRLLSADTFSQAEGSRVGPSSPSAVCQIRSLVPTLPDSLRIGIVVSSALHYGAPELQWLHLYVWFLDPVRERHTLMAHSSKGLRSILQKHPGDVVILSALRTPITRAYKGGLRNAYPEQLLAAVRLNSAQLYFRQHAQFK